MATNNSSRRSSQGLRPKPEDPVVELKMKDALDMETNYYV
jgi:hypothetical protein